MLVHVDCCPSNGHWFAFVSVTYSKNSSVTGMIEEFSYFAFECVAMECDQDDLEVFARGLEFDLERDLDEDDNNVTVHMDCPSSVPVNATDDGEGCRELVFSDRCSAALDILRNDALMYVCCAALIVVQEHH